METIDTDERRDCVRAALCVDVQFSLLNADEYKNMRDEGAVERNRRCLVQPVKQVSSGGEDKSQIGGIVDSNLVDFLIHLEDKLDHMLKLLVKHEEGDDSFFVAKGLDIGGKGMRILCEKQVEPGQLLDTRFRAFRYPVVSLNIVGEVIRAKPVQRGAKTYYEIALEFLDLDQDSKEWIISYVFQMQREAIRSGKR